jgi:hypothetical protein
VPSSATRYDGSRSAKDSTASRSISSPSTSAILIARRAASRNAATSIVASTPIGLVRFRGVFSGE